eukprot:TRINITY_DN4420_c0_g1_i1.p1 TRINITY_DN4420_c0_g1~~TRINITY_DN4420_c0_g1_i1.p1  ORF type:complete len:131 (+),score=50.86 TRINITY_DN4420_c0_g1_i1:127-519(+)
MPMSDFITMLYRIEKNFEAKFLFVLKIYEPENRIFPPDVVVKLVTSVLKHEKVEFSEDKIKVFMNMISDKRQDLSPRGNFVGFSEDYILSEMMVKPLLKEFFNLNPTSTSPPVMRVEQTAGRMRSNSSIF